MSFRTVSIALSILFLLVSSAFSSNASGKALSDTVYKAITESGFKNTTKLNIATTGRDEFAYNITVNFSANKAKSNTENEEAVDRDSFQNIRRTKMILDFMQEDFSEKKEEFIDFLKTLEADKERKIDVTVLFSALDESTNITGTEIFTDSIDDTDTTFAGVFRFGGYRANTILTGNKSRITPLWLTKQVTDAFIRINHVFEVGHTIASLYRLGILDGDKRMENFTTNNIPAVAVYLKSDGTNGEFDFLKTFANGIDINDSGEWDTHYIFLELKRPFKPVWITERMFLIACISVMTLSLLILCGFTFAGKFGRQHKLDFMRSWYMIPLSIAISVFTMIAGQRLLQSVDALRAMNPIYQFGGKIIFSTVFISMTFLLQEKMHLPIKRFVYGYIPSIVAILNMFVFSSVDITFFVIFGIEYLIITFSRPAKRIPFIAFWALVMMMPFAPFAYTLIKHARLDALRKIVFCTWDMNIILATALLPFEIMWQKILVRVNIIIGMKGFGIVRAIITYVTSVCIFLSLSMFGLFFIKKFFYVENPDIQQAVTSRSEGEERNLSVSVVENEFLGMNTNHIKISSKKDALRYRVTIKGDGQLPIYESTYNYFVTGENEASFVIPDFPPKSITIDYAANSEHYSEIKVTAVYDEDGELFSETMTKKINGKEKSEKDGKSKTEKNKNEKMEKAKN